MAAPWARVASVTASQACAVVALAPLGVALGAAPGEGEVEAGAVGVGVGLVGRGGQGPSIGLERADDLVEEAGERRPRARDLGGVDHDAGRARAGPGPRRRCGARASARPVATSSGCAPASAVHSVVDDRQRGRRAAPGSASSSTMRTLVSPLLEVPLRLGLVVEAQHRRRGAPAQDPAAGLEAGGERGEAEGPPLLGRRQRVDAEPRLGDDAEGALAARRRAGSGWARWPPAGPGPRCARRGRRPGRPRGRSPCPRSSRSGSSTGRRRGRPASRRRSRGPSTGASARACSPSPTSPSAASRSGPNVPARTSAVSEVSSTSTRPVEPGQVERDAAVDRDRAAADAAAPGRRR